MTIKQILAEITTKETCLSPERYPRFQDIVSLAGKYNIFTLYSDRSRSIDDIISVIGMITTDGSPLLSIVSSFLLQRQTGVNQVYFNDGLRTSLHTHNYAELGYVVEGQYHAHIEGRDYVFNKGDIFLINRDILHCEYLYRKNQAVLFLAIVNTFFNKSIQHDAHDRKTEEFLQQFVIDGV
jgi:hypothetical protein